MPLFESGATATEHGPADMETPGTHAKAVMIKITRLHEPTNPTEDA